MKKLWLMMILVMGLTVALSWRVEAQEWKTANQVTVLWDPVTVATGTVSYKTYYRPASSGPEVFTYVSTITEVQATITFTLEGRYFLGVRSVRNVDGIEVESSTISWSDNPLVCAGGVTFGVQYYIPPPNVGGLKLQ